MRLVVVVRCKGNEDPGANGEFAISGLFAFDYTERRDHVARDEQHQRAGDHEQCRGYAVSADTIYSTSRDDGHH